MIEVLAPDVCTEVEYDNRNWRVAGWYCAAERPVGDDVPARLSQMMFDASHDFGDGMRLRACLREEATHIEIVGITGYIVSVLDCRVVGRIAWSESRVNEERGAAVLAGLEGEVIF